MRYGLQEKPGKIVFPKGITIQINKEIENEEGYHGLHAGTSIRMAGFI
jgi:hypothetical protein